MIEPSTEGRAVINKHWVRGIMAMALAASCHAELKITVYDGADLPREVVLDALDRLRAILEKAGIGSRPVLGNPAEPDASLFLYVAVPMASGARRDIALKIVHSSPLSLPQGVLGMSSPFAPAGLNVRVFDDHVQEAAERHGVEHGLVLSYAMAHEIGHVLMQSGGHSSRGIMSAVWKKEEYARMAQGGLGFSNEDALRIRSWSGGWPGVSGDGLRGPL